MKYVRFKQGETDKYGVLKEEEIIVLTGSPLNGDSTQTDEKVNIEEVRLISPLVPNEIIGIGANFFADEKDRPEWLPDTPIFFSKPKHSVIGTGDSIELPPGVESVKFESEIAVIIGKQARNIDESDYLDYIFGITVANDVTSPDYFREDGHWFVGKSFPSFTPLGPVIETDVKLENVMIQSYVNGKPFQNSPTSHMIISIPQMITYLSQVTVLNPGDVILTGSPVGADFVKAGDVVSCTVTGVSTLENPVIQSKTTKKVTLI
ncbi:DUF2437 domain-containing protein [Ornithinibacillus sp. L9]|uniref:DUF2437 domain-containing protein n=1 Tax=Ornithinibacillus caprae TaxID=2678566 RepID=A0A6N8FFP0_9BACI|nr:fumarylacetoacetate hydrolase family protein [Ornithinibacillus caprae]MUK87516.1 DUF2437 domain-containing protein [Ornithinibacillus caprae]